MTNFSYTAHTKEHTLQKGTVVANDRVTAIDSLKKRGLTPVVVKPLSKKKNFDINFDFLQRKVKATDMVVFTRELATMINAGVPIIKCLHTLHDQTESPVLRKTLDSVVAKVEGGAPLSDALEEHPKVFSLVYVNMVRAGEAGGILDKILDRLAMQVEKDADIKGKVKGAMIYPSIIVIITVGAFIFLMTGIVPKLKNIFEQYKAELPLQTKIMLSISNVMQKYWWLVILVIIGIVFAINRGIKTPKGKHIFDTLLLKMPIFGKVILKANVARFARTFGSLTGAGVSVLEALNVTSKSLNNSVLSKGIDRAAEDVKNGQSISDALEQYTILPAIVSQMIAVGEETGKVAEVLDKVADFYEKEVDRVVANITSIIEPLLIVVLGGMVGLIVASVFGPISSLSDVVK